MDSNRRSEASKFITYVLASVIGHARLQGMIAEISIKFIPNAWAMMLNVHARSRGLRSLAANYGTAAASLLPT